MWHENNTCKRITFSFVCMPTFNETIGRDKIKKGEKSFFLILTLYLLLTTYYLLLTTYYIHTL